MDDSEYSRSSLRARTGRWAIDVVSPGLILLTLACVAGIVLIAIFAEGESYLAYLVLLSIAGFSLATYHSFTMMRRLAEQTGKLMNQARSIEERVAQMKAASDESTEEDPP